MRALAAHPAVPRLGDATIQYMPPLLLGALDRPAPGLPETVVATAAATCAVCALGLGFADGPLWALASLSAVASIAAVATLVLERLRRAPRRFAVNFDVQSIRLDVPTRYLGAPRSLYYNFDQVMAIRLIFGGRRYEVVAELQDVRTGMVRRHQLVTGIGDRSIEHAERLVRLLRAAFGMPAGLNE